MLIYRYNQRPQSPSSLALVQCMTSRRAEYSVLLWEMAEASGVGLEIDLKKIPVRQETIEVCEFFGINPYQLISSGCMLMAAEDGNLLVRELEKAGIPATIIGKATAGNDRVLLNEEERRFLEPPKADELYKAI